MKLVVPTPALSLTATLSPNPVVARLVVPTPNVTAGAGEKIISPAAIPVKLVVPTPALSLVATLSPTPAVVKLVVTTPFLNVGAALFEPWGVLQSGGNPALGLERIIDPSKYEATALFFIEVGFFTDGGITLTARLFNVSDGVPVAASAVTTTASAFEVKRSGTWLPGAAGFPNSEKKYRLEFGGASGGVFSFYGGDVMVEVS